MNRHAKIMATPHSRLVDSITEKLVSAVTEKQVSSLTEKLIISQTTFNFGDYVTLLIRDLKPTSTLILTLTPSKLSLRGIHTQSVVDNRLVEKFAVLGRDDIAEPLERILPYVISQDANVEILTLLLALSDRPIETVEFDESKFIVEQVVEKGITWEEIIAEEPLSGDHWREPDYSGSDEESDWVYETKSSIIPELPVTEIKKTEEARLNEAPTTSIEEFLQQQYWIRRKKYVLSNAEYSPELGFGGIYLD